METPISEIAYNIATSVMPFILTGIEQTKESIKSVHEAIAKSVQQAMNCERADNNQKLEEAVRTLKALSSLYMPEDNNQYGWLAKDKASQIIKSFEGQ